MNTQSEELRIADLKSFNFDDGYPKEQLKSIIKLASKICDAPISLIDIIDEFNQRTIVTHGEWEEQVIPREKSICDKVVVNGEMLIVNDIESNEEISSRLSKEDLEKIKFYAGAPLISPEGFILGALCIIDSKPNELSEFQKESLQILADEVMARLLLHKKTRHLKKNNKTLEKYAYFLNNSADLLCIIDSKTNLIVDINEDCHKELGFTRDELIHKKYTDFVDSEIDIQKSITSWFDKAKSNKNRLSLPVKLKNKQGEVKWYRCNFTSENNQWYLTARNINDQKKAEERVAALRSKLEKVAYATTDLIYETDLQRGEITWSGDLTGILGYPETDKHVDFEWWREKIHPDDVDDVMQELNEVLESDTIKWNKTYRFRTFDGSYKYVLNNSHFDRDSNGAPKVILGAIADITLLKQSEIRQQDLLSKLKHANHLAKLGFWEIDLKNNDSIACDDEMYHILNLKRKPKNPTLDLIFNRLDKNEEIKFLDFILNIKKDKSIIEHEHKISTTNSIEKYLVHRGELIRENDEPTKILITTQDITERKFKELRIEESLKEKQVLLAEIHHRVKNNLAIISALLEMNLFDNEDENTVNFIRGSQGRIKSMAKVHEQLYKSESFTHISFKDYIHELIESIQSSLRPNEYQIQINTNIKDSQLNLNYAIPCGLILNELITNSWKHAFPNQKTGTISISFYSEGEKMHLSVEDDGVGLPDGYDYEKASSLGMTLINILSQQIDANLSIGNNNKGFICRLTFLQEDKRKGSSNSLE